MIADARVGRCFAVYCRGRFVDVEIVQFGFITLADAEEYAKQFCPSIRHPVAVEYGPTILASRERARAAIAKAGAA